MIFNGNPYCCLLRFTVWKVSCRVNRSHLWYNLTNILYTKKLKEHNTKTLYVHRTQYTYHLHLFRIRGLLLLGGELLAERCRTDDLMPSIPFLCLPLSRVDPKVLGPNVFVYHSQPGGSWSTRRSPPIRWWSQHSGDDTVVVLLWSWSSQVPTKSENEKQWRVHIGWWQEGTKFCTNFLISHDSQNRSEH